MSPVIGCFSASIRRGSMKGDRDVLFKREHKEEALHFGHNLITDQDCLTVSLIGCTQPAVCFVVVMAK